MPGPTDDPGGEARAGDAAPLGTPGTEEMVCEECQGAGELMGRPCQSCNGTGMVNRRMSDKPGIAVGEGPEFGSGRG
jgi:DnaJ-class molecular chaperone